MHEVRKFLEQDKGKQITNPSLEVEVPQGSKKRLYVQMIAGGPTLMGKSKRVIKHYSKSSILDRPGKEVNFTCQNHFRVS